MQRAWSSRVSAWHISMAGTRQVWRDAGRAIRWCAGRVQYRADYTGVRADTGGSMGMGVASREHSEARYSLVQPLSVVTVRRGT